jgi:hypothetical protein
VGARAKRRRPLVVRRRRLWRLAASADARRRPWSRGRQGGGGRRSRRGGCPSDHPSDRKVSLPLPLVLFPTRFGSRSLLVSVPIGGWWCEIGSGRNPWSAGLTTAVATPTGAVYPS